MSNSLIPLRSIVIFMPRFLGDCINCTPALKLIEMSYPNTKITLVIRNIPAQAFERFNKYQFIIDERPKDKLKSITSLIKSLKNESFDAGILMTNTFIDAAIARLSNIKNLVGYNKEMRKPLLSNALKLDTRRHYINRYAYLGNALCGNQHKKLPAVELTHDKEKSVLFDIKITKIGFCIVSKNKMSRHYPSTQCAKVIELLNQKINKEAAFYMLGTSEEVNEAEQVVNICQEKNIPNVYSLAGKTTIPQLIDTIADLDLLITVDSGPLHVAAATKTLTIALHSKGTSAFSTVCPKGQQVHVIDSRGGYIDDNDQVLDLLPEDIVKKAAFLLN